MSELVLTKDSILEATEVVLRHFGPSKANVVDVARALKVSHGAVYRHFPSKSALRDAVVRKWLAEMMPPLDAIVEEKGAASDRLWKWIRLLFETKRRHAFTDPELFATYHELALGAREVVAEHVEHLGVSVARILSDGMELGEFKRGDPNKLSKAILSATARFHNPLHSDEWKAPETDEALSDVWKLIYRGIIDDNSNSSPN